MIRAVIFDFDGLILETEQPEYQSWCEIYEEQACTLPSETWNQLIGLPWDAIAFNPYEYLEAQLGRALDREMIQSRRRLRYQELVEAQPVRPGVEAWIAAAEQLSLKLGVASSSSRAWVMEHLERLELDRHFLCVSCREDVVSGKPDPAVYLATLQRLGVEASAAVALEDSPHGVLAAKRAGIFCIAVPSLLTRDLPFPNPDLVVDSLADLSLVDLLTSFQQPAGPIADLSPRADSL